MGRFLAILTAIFIVAAGCGSSTGTTSQGGQNSLADLGDKDQDGWFDGPVNRQVTLTLTSARFDHAGGFKIVVDNLPFPRGVDSNGRVGVGLLEPPITKQLNFPVAERFRGVAHFGESKPFTARVHLDWNPPLGSTIPIGDADVTFGEEDGDLAPVTVTSGLLGVVCNCKLMTTLNFKVTATKFADPSPAATSDLDGDGLTEKDEAMFAARFGIGDPRPGGARDIVVVVGATDPAYHLIDFVEQDLQARFASNGWALHLDDGRLGGKSAFGGPMSAPSGLSLSVPLNSSQAKMVRDANVPASFRAKSYFALLSSAAVSSVDGSGLYGEGNGVPGSSLVESLGGIPGGIAWYQGGVFMHELGHLLGLCHPTMSDGTGGCAAIPVSERDPGATVMGAPSEDTNFISKGINLLRRPQDYSPTQWTQLRPGAGFEA